MILKALYDYYNRGDNLPAPGMEEKEIGFIISYLKKVSSSALKIVELTIKMDEHIL